MGLRELNKWWKLGISVVIDAVGALPTVLGWLGVTVTGGLSILLLESIDLVWAPISASLVYKLYGQKSLAFVNAGEELIPGTDIVPTALIGWFSELFNKKEATSLNSLAAYCKANPEDKKCWKV